MPFSKLTTVLGLISCSLFWGINAIIAREYRYISDSFDLNFYRWFFSFILLTPFAYRSVLKDFAIIRANLLKLLVLATLSITLFNAFQYQAGETTSSINLGLINAMNPIFVMILSWPILKQKPTIVMIFGTLFSFFGVALVILQEGIFSFDWYYFNIGDLWMLIAVILWAFYGIYNRFFSIQIDLISFLWITILLGLFVSPFASSLHNLSFALTIPVFYTELFWVYVFTSIFPGILAFLFWNRGVRDFGPVISSLFLYLTPCFIAIISYFLFDNVFTKYHLIGGVMIFIGFCSVFIKNKKNQPV